MKSPKSIQEIQSHIKNGKVSNRKNVFDFQKEAAKSHSILWSLQSFFMTKNYSPNANRKDEIERLRLRYKVFQVCLLLEL